MLTWVIYNKFQEIFLRASDPRYVLNVSDWINKGQISLPYLATTFNNPPFNPFLFTDCTTGLEYWYEVNTCRQN